MLASILPITALGELNCFVHGNEGSQPQSPTIPTRLLVCLGHRSINLRSQDCVVIDQLFQQRKNLLHIWQICEERLNPTVFSRNSSTQRVGGMLEIRLVGDGELWSPISLQRRGSWRYRTHALKWSWDVLLLVFMLGPMWSTVLLITPAV